MHEKYDATRPGERGGGGEYTPQVGFGWTNGVALWLLARYCDESWVAELGRDDAV
jgi:alpha,alpha-trehalase